MENNFNCFIGFLQVHTFGNDLYCSIITDTNNKDNHAALARKQNQVMGVNKWPK